MIMTYDIVVNDIVALIWHNDIIVLQYRDRDSHIVIGYTCTK